MVSFQLNFIIIVGIAIVAATCATDVLNFFSITAIIKITFFVVVVDTVIIVYIIVMITTIVVIITQIFLLVQLVVIHLIRLKFVILLF